MSTASPDILLTDDSPHDASFLLRAISKKARDATVRVCTDGVEAVEVLTEGHARGARPPRLVLMDLHMPRMSGIEAVRRIREEAAFRGLPVVIFSTSSEPEDVRAAYEAGATSYLVKPMELRELDRVTECITTYWLDLNRTAASV